MILYNSEIPAERELLAELCANMIYSGKLVTKVLYTRVGSPKQLCTDCG